MEISGNDPQCHCPYFSHNPVHHLSTFRHCLYMVRHYHRERTFSVSVPILEKSKQALLNFLGSLQTA